MSPQIKTLLKPVASLRLTIVLLALSLVLVFLGTMAQEPLGLYLAQARFFHSAFVDLASMTAAVKKALQMVHVYLEPSDAAEVQAAPYIPVYPGGYLLGSLLVINLITAHAFRFRFTWKKTGILMVHAGLILLLVGQLFTDLFAKESAMRLTEGETKSYSESDRRSELAVVDSTSSERDRVVAIPQGALDAGVTIRRPELPFAVHVLRYYPNSDLTTNRASAPDAPEVSRGMGRLYFPVGLPRVTDMNSRDVPSAVVELQGPEGSVGSLLLSEHLARPETLAYKDHTYELTLRPQRHYLGFSLSLLDFRHDVYPGTDKPKNFSSDVRLRNPSTREDRQVRIYMNNPLRYEGLTFYQASFDPRDERVTILQVVRNPVWLTPYVACLAVGLGLLVQFGIHLVGFLRRRQPVPAQPEGSPSRRPAPTPSASA